MASQEDNPMSLDYLEAVAYKEGSGQSMWSSPNSNV
jgi:hypothetical protein